MVYSCTRNTMVKDVDQVSINGEIIRKNMPLGFIEVEKLYRKYYSQSQLLDFHHDLSKKSSRKSYPMFCQKIEQ